MAVNFGEDFKNLLEMNEAITSSVKYIDLDVDIKHYIVFDEWPENEDPQWVTKLKGIRPDIDINEIIIFGLTIVTYGYRQMINQLLNDERVIEQDGSR